MADQPLSPATDRGLGEPLPHQLPNRTRAHLRPGLLPFISSRCQEVTLCGISNGFPLLFHCLRQITHVLLTRPPLAHSGFSTNTVSLCAPVRLACVKHAASVHPEPGSNSQIFKFESQFGSFFFFLVLPVKLQSLTRAPLFHCSIFKVRSLSLRKAPDQNTTGILDCQIFLKNLLISPIEN